MKSGLRDRNNGYALSEDKQLTFVSMKSGLRDRNNPRPPSTPRKNPHRLNEVRS